VLLGNARARIDSGSGRFRCASINPGALDTSYPTSKVVGGSVVNEASETVGTIDDLIVTPSDKMPFAVLSVGFLGMGTEYVVAPYSTLEVRDKKMVLAGPRKIQYKQRHVARLTKPRSGVSKGDAK
jgi:PRC-barrel domain